MSDEIFTHADTIQCPECPGIKLRNGSVRKPNLYVSETNFSGSGMDYGNCPECGKGFCISYKVDTVVRDTDWDSKPLKVLEAEEKEYQRKEKLKQLAKLKKELGEND